MPLSALAIWVALLELTEILIHFMGLPYANGSNSRFIMFPERELVCGVCKGLIGEEFYSTLSL